MNAHADLNKRKIISDVALGRIPPDTVIKNGRLFNPFTGEFIDRQSIWIKHGMIAFVGPDPNPANSEGTRMIDADGMVLLPGLVEGHTHILSSRYSIEEFIRHVIPSGVTTVITEAVEYLVVVGICTHLGCSPTFRKEVGPADLGADWPGGWFCPCHGSRFDLAARVFNGSPAPTNLVIPPHKYLSDIKVLIGVDQGAAG